MNRIKIFLLILALPSVLNAQYTVPAIPTQTENYVMTRTYKSAPGDMFSDQVQYFDGLGRLTQTVRTAASGDQWNDIVTLQEYDAFGRESKAWLPVIAYPIFENGVWIHDNGQYISNFKEIARQTYNDTNAYSTTVYEPSPIGRVAEQYGPGQNWYINHKSVKTERFINKLTPSTDPLVCKKIIIDGDNLKLAATAYPAHELFVTKTTGEEGEEFYEFTDKLGRVVLQRRMNGTTKYDTYFVYDEYNTLRYVLPPLAADKITSTTATYSETNDFIKQFAYIYKYNARNLCKWKKLPGCEPIYYVYDSGDRLIFSQDGEQRKNNFWQFSIPDNIGRPAITGFCTNSLSYENIISSPVYATRTNTTNAWKGYTVCNFTLSSPRIMTANYYDDYNFVGYNEIPTTVGFLSTEDRYNQQWTNATGLLTGTLTAVLSSVSYSASTYLWSVMYYDNKNQLIQRQSNTYPSVGNETEYIAYNFDGTVAARHHTVGSLLDEHYRYEYDHESRLVSTFHRIGTANEKFLSYNHYDELGRLQGVYPLGDSYLSTTYAYNIRSWITAIESNYYNEKLTYLFNGNVASKQWYSSKNSTSKRTLTYSYDKLSRLTSAVQTQGITSSESYSEWFMYDKMGNITTLYRDGRWNINDFDALDRIQLTYTGNQLTRVSDNMGNSLLNASNNFRDYYTGTTAEFAYNAVGSMTKDLNRGISSISYNAVGQPRMLEIINPVAQGINFHTYAADGRRLQTVKRWNPNYSSTPVIGSSFSTEDLTQSNTISYISNMVQESNPSGLTILTDNGYYKSGTYYVYIKDYLGNNVRVVNATSRVSEQETHYYPSGLPMDISSGSNAQPALKFIGKEMDLQHGIVETDLGARGLIHHYGRFGRVDPLAEKYYAWSPYCYGLCNAVNNIDPDGKEVINGHLSDLEELKRKLQQQKEAFNAKYDGNTKMSKNDFASKGEWKDYKDNRSALNKIQSDFNKCEKLFNNTQSHIDNFKAVDPVGFDQVNNLTYTNLAGETKTLDIYVFTDNNSLSNRGGAYTAFVCHEASGNIYLPDGNVNLLDRTHVLLGNSVSSSSSALAHEFGHNVALAADPIQYWRDSRNVVSGFSCQDWQNRYHPVAAKALEWQHRYEKLYRNH